MVNVCLNAVGNEPISMVTHYCAKEKKQFQAKQPHMVKAYNEHMGGVDRMDQNIQQYRTGIRGEKWYTSIVTYCIIMAIKNALQLHKLWGKNAIDLLALRRSNAHIYLEQ